ncbi:helix-turn-helix transcriptional regulator [Streptomyces sp. DH7]|uniref:ArsR/SmtB family transcription factor n=1 Tax=Streptomyces sp. DH7 TaxID=2857006 RepID=UPI001E5AE359|nr:metalloregulator ArsR/SmtB family transcription factor [Streptomyces sp. DH7]
MGHAADMTIAGATVLERLESTGAADVATTLQALSTASRLRILACLRQGPQSATGLATASGMQRSACSHQLRLLRNLGLVTADRQGRSVIYSLYDEHVGELLEQALFHVNHLRLNARS